MIKNRKTAATSENTSYARRDFFRGDFFFSLCLFLPIDSSAPSGSSSVQYCEGSRLSIIHKYWLTASHRRASRSGASPFLLIPLLFLPFLLLSFFSACLHLHASHPCLLPVSSPSASDCVSAPHPRLLIASLHPSLRGQTWIQQWRTQHTKL